MAVTLLPSAQALEPGNEPLFALTPVSGTIMNGGQGTDDILDPGPSAEDTGGPGPQVHVPAGWISSGGMGFQIDALSNDHASVLVATPVRICFSVDANAVGAAGTAVAAEAAVGQAAADLYVTRNAFNLMNPAPVPGADGNILAINQPAFTLAPTAAPGVGPAGWPNPAFAADDMSAHTPYAIDIVGNDQWHELPIWWSFVTGSGGGIPDPTPPERRPTGADLMLSPAPPGLAYYAKANLMGLDKDNDDLDAVIVFDVAANGIVDPGVDVAVFSVAPGSALDAIGGNVYWTSFMNNNFLIADNASLGLGPNDNLDALTVYVGQLQGDWDDDGDVDLDDYDAFDDCATNGPDVPYPPGQGCEEFDFDGDGDVDLEDFAKLQELYTSSAVCGNGSTEGSEECDDGGESATCDADCTVAACGDGTLNVTAGEECDDGGESATCDADCTVGECGDETVNTTAGEECDDGGESATCDDDCTLAECGDSTVNVTAGEECDDGGESATCNVDCTLAECGDGILNVTAGEECDDGGESVVCDVDCTVAECGDNTLNVTAGEECDDGNDDNTDSCLVGCIDATCGDGFLWVGVEECDDGGESAVCDVDCTVAECGDGVLNVTAGEECDDGGESATCDADCTVAECGDDTVNVTADEECDDGGESATCDDNCTWAWCGDGTLNETAGEECDDGNTNGGDGCSAVCTNELSDCTINFDASCPNVTPECGASFSGGVGCVSVGDKCNDTSPGVYRLDTGSTLVITLDGDLNALSVAFTGFFGSEATMEFFDADGLPVDDPLASEGDCVIDQTTPRRKDFTRPVRSIEVVVTSGDIVFIDTFHVNPP